MSGRDLLLNPCWRASDLGHPLPDSPHAVSVALPRWRDVIAYEEEDPACRSVLRSGYPRFVMPPLLQQLVTEALAGVGQGEGGSGATSAWPYPTMAAASLAQSHCQRGATDGACQIHWVRGLPCLICNEQATPAARAFWQHAGLGASTRLVAVALKREPAASLGQAHLARQRLRQRLAGMHGCDPSLVRLLPSGMAALHLAVQAISQLKPKRPTLQVGFPYVDVLKLPQVIFSGGTLLMNSGPEWVAAALEESGPAAVIVELPSNPMLSCADLPELARLTRSRDIPLIVDDTIGSSLNIETRPHADLVFTSLTKSFAGSGDIMAGSLVVSADSPWREDLTALTRDPAASLSDPDAIALEVASRDVEQRVRWMNRRCQQLAERLEGHPAVARVLHPGRSPHFQRITRPGGGGGCLLSFELRGGEESAKRVFDALAVCKGPSLGTPFTLACPYVLLAHYAELDWAERCGVPRHLIRVSVGLEPPEELWERFERALHVA